MARLAPLDLKELPELEGLFSLVEQAMGFVPNSMLTMAHRPAMLTAFATLAGSALGPGEVDVQLKHLIGEVASKAAGCQYCVAHTSHSAHRAGVDSEKLDAVWSFDRSDLFSPAEKAALTLAMNAAQVPNQASDDDFDALKQYYSDPQIVEIMGVIALFGFLNRWNDTVATTLESAPISFADEKLPKDQWSGDKHRPY